MAPVYGHRTDHDMTRANGTALNRAVYKYTRELGREAGTLSIRPHLLPMPAAYHARKVCQPYAPLLTPMLTFLSPAQTSAMRGGWGCGIAPVRQDQDTGADS